MSNVTVTLGLKTAGFKRGVEDARRDMRTLKSEAEKGGGLFGRMGSGLATLGLGAYAKDVADYADNIADLSERLGVNAVSLQKWGQLAAQNGSSLEGVGKALNKLTIAREDALGGNTALIATFESLGVSLEDLRTMNVDQIMAQIGRGAMNAADMVKVLGKEAVALRPTLEAAADGGLGGLTAMSRETIDILSEAKDQVVDFAAAIRNIFGTALAWVAGQWRDTWRAIGAGFSILEMMTQGYSFSEAREAANKALGDMSFEDLKRQSGSGKPRPIDEDGAHDQRQKEVQRQQEKVDQAERAASDLRGEQHDEIEGMKRKQHDDWASSIYDRLRGGAGYQTTVGQMMRNARQQQRMDERADRALARAGYSAADIQRIKDSRDPIKQAELAHARALKPLEGKLEEAVAELVKLNDKESLG